MSIEDRRRRQLVAAAVRVVARDGVAGASTRAVTAEAGIPLGSLHYAFGSREALLDAVLAHTLEGELKAIERAGFPTGAPGTDLLRAHVVTGLGRYLDLLCAEPSRETALLDLFLWSMRRSDGRGTLPLYRTYYAMAADVLTDAATSCGCTWTLPVEQVARLLVVTVDGLTTTWLADGDTLAARTTIELHARMLASLATPATPQEAAAEPVTGEPVAAEPDVASGTVVPGPPADVDGPVAPAVLAPEDPAAPAV
ncbi:TetR/AcrR family transcriptional regulator [Cellulomonas iranensis]|uniref:TetR/AcrR family transcriptional regulator n=1 Tax=Cellulomonas iranensis TaxID=76862 RepID=UPI0015C6177C|nr:TetR/AcrR family transcriptional regulator [Cellulomonas iranensis]